MTKEQIEKRVAALEVEVERQRDGMYCHFTGANMTRLMNEISNLRDQLEEKDFAGNGPSHGMPRAGNVDSRAASTPELEPGECNHRGQAQAVATGNIFRTKHHEA